MATLYQPVAYAMKGNTASTSALPISDSSWNWGANDLAQADQAIVACNTNGAVVSWDGTDPTASLGVPLAAGEWIKIVDNENVQNISLIRSGLIDAAVSIILEKYS